MARELDLTDTTLADAAAAIRRREVSPVEVLDATIARIEQRNPSLNALVFVAFDEARLAARSAEHAVMDGSTLPPLHGVPAAIKDLFDFKPGWPATLGGIPALREQRVDAYCLFAERVERAGAILVGKGNAPAMGFRGTCDNRLFGPTRNPFDTTRNSGGSSGGCAAAVADGLLTFAEGTDGGGSIRIPASWCGLYGFKASFGRVPQTGRPNAFASTNPFLFEGPLTRTVEDAAIVLDVIAGYDARDPYALCSTTTYVDVVARGVAGMRIGYTPDYGSFPVDSRITEVVAAAVASFEAAGAAVEEVSLDLGHDQSELSDLWCRLIMPSNVATVEALKMQGIDLLRDHPDDLPPQYREWLARGYAMTVVEIARDQAMRTQVYDAFQAAFTKYDLIVGPTLCCLPVENSADGNTVGPSQIGGVAVDELIGWCPTYLVNYIGHPAASVPAGLADGLPVGLQIIGRRYADDDVLAASAVIERLRPWRQTYSIPAQRSLTPILGSTTGVTDSRGH